ncbi:MAG: SIS domain-containing protein [Akkermansiaceae bacterium]|nr:SIS domain-containing protein [Akkermansiaceae bacterium]NNM29039.1 SIS domain-containing protein [Akkermansiaceae bacterium]
MPSESLEEFLEVASEFRLGDLVTEQPHPLTTDLSKLARDDLAAAIATLKEVDLGALALLQGYAPVIEPLAVAMADTLAAGQRVFLCGCGATGRLSISLEVFARRGFLGEATGDQLVGFMAGGDAALVRSIERFEDYPEHAVRQLHELEFGPGDLLVGITEGGETSFVIGATEEAARTSSRQPFFLYCNPDEVLARVATRSKRILENDAVRKINLSVGPMAITGSTRMQASTVQMAAAGWALARRTAPDRLAGGMEAFRGWVEATDFSFLVPFIEKEEALYERGSHVLYEPGEFGITVLTDTTERSPTFSLPPFENVLRPEDVLSGCYLHVEAESSAQAWESLLDRAPRTLSWGGLEHLTGEGNLLGFDFSDQVVARREAAGTHVRFRVANEPDAIALHFGNLSHRIPAAGRDSFSRHLLLKLVLNIHSTLVMGRWGRFEGNVMTYVNATNRKLIDRAIRYVLLILDRQDGLQPSYEDVARELFRVRDDLKRDEPIVMKTVRAFRQAR